MTLHCKQCNRFVKASHEEEYPEHDVRTCAPRGEAQAIKKLIAEKPFEKIAVELDMPAFQASPKPIRERASKPPQESIPTARPLPIWEKWVLGGLGLATIVYIFNQFRQGQ